MSRVKDLEIRGIRNFGDESAKALLHFSKPLSLILGPNGTGKTTIIEALKFITSGEYPPDSDRGKSFVHEPKLTLNHTVRGQVKAKIIDKKGHELVVTRTMQVTRQKSGTLKFQALDNTITRIDPKTKEKIQISNRCADIDREMLDAMGVSKPILNYVIFCHQEESNWPLEDGKKLKDKFDEIFDTSKYNKAMDTTTKLIKDLQVEINVLKVEEKSLKDIVSDAEQQEEKLKDDERRALEALERMNEIDMAIIPIEKRMKEIRELGKEYEKLEAKYKKYEIDYDITNGYIETLKKHIKQIHKGSKEELMEKIESFDLNLSQKVDNKKQHEIDLEKLEKNENILLKKLADARIQLGSLTQKKIAFDEKVSRRNALLMKTLDRWEMSQIDSELSEEEVKDYIVQIKEKIEKFSTSMKNKIREHEQEEKHVQREVDTSRAEKTGIESEMALKDKERREIKIEINELRRKIGDAKGAGEKIQSLESNLQNATKNYDALVQSFDENSIKAKLQDEIAKKKKLDKEITEIDQEINSLHQQSSQQTELEMYQKDLKEKEKNVSVLKNKHKDNLESLLGAKEIQEKKLKDTLERTQKSLSNEIHNLEKQIEEEQQKCTMLETTAKYKEREISKTNAEFKSLEEKVIALCDDNDYDAMLLLQQKKVKSLQDQRGIYANQSLIYEEFLKRLKKKSCCPLCDRGFGNSTEERQLEQKIFAEIKKTPQALNDCEKELKKEQTRYDALQRLKPITEQAAQIENVKLPKLEASLVQTKSDLEKAEQNLEELRMVLSEPEEKLKICKEIFPDISLLDKYVDERDSLKQKIENKKRDMLKAGKIGDRSMQETQNERQNLKEKHVSTEKSIEKIQSTLQAGQEKIQRAREHKNKLNEEVIQIRHDMQAVSQLREKVKELYDKESSLEESLKALRQKLVVAEDDLSTKVTDLNSLKQKNREEQEKDINFKSKNATEFHELKTVQEEVLKFMTSKIEENLKKIEADVEKTRKDCEDAKTERLSLEERIRFLDEQCRSQQTGKKELENNLELMNKQEHIEVVNEELAKHKTLLENMQYDKLKKEFQRKQLELDDLEKEKSSRKGAQGELENSIKLLKRSLNQEKYRMARHNHKKKQLKLVVQEEAIANLKAYVTVLDKAMIQFHEERMNTVNNIMRQLWNLIYGGNDTSSIQIRVQTTEGIGDKKRSYNYKLVQVKRSTEMDMKGKCSAGQKVLASIIIRMALAETFCSDCAVLALDEPTTNLDVENATNLAVTLSKVIQLRAQHQKNFQLIVISHDEKFIGQLSNLSGKQVFQELYRNLDGYSEVRKRDMSEYTRNSSQSQATNKFDDEDSDDEENENKIEMNHQNGRKRGLEMDDSPPHGRATKRRAYH